MTMITPSYLGETIEYSSLHACRSTLEDPTVNTSVFNAIAVLIVSVSLSPLPFGAGVGATATVLILGSHGLADTAAAGVLLTVTGTAAALCYAAWACGDHAVGVVRTRRAGLAGVPPAPAAPAVPLPVS